MGNAVGVGQLPPTQFNRGDPVTASQLRDIAEQAARPNQLQRTMPGLNFGAFIGNPEFKMPNLFFEGILLEDMRASTDPFDDPVVVQMKVIKPLNHKENSDQEALSFADIGDEVYIVNRALDISGSTGDRVLCVVVSGELRPTGGGGGSNQDICDFTITNYGASIGLISACNFVRATVTNVGCGSSVSIGDDIFVWDKPLCWFNLPVSLLIGLSGTAHWMKNPGLGDVACPGTDADNPCVWVVKGLCCYEEVYG